MKLLALVISLLAIGCHVPPAESPVPAVSSWALVSRSNAELDGEVQAGVARIAPSSTIFVLEPVIERGALRLDAICHHRMNVRYAPADRLQVGQVAAVEVSIDTEARARHLVRVRPTRSGIVLLTPTTLPVAAARPFWIRFTGASAGEGGVAIEVLECQLEDK